MRSFIARAACHRTRCTFAFVWLCAILLVATVRARAETPPAPDHPPAARAVTISAIAEFVALRTSLLGPEVSGRVERVLVDVGDRVKRGDPLVELDAAIYRAERKRAQALLTLARARRDKAKRDYDRMEALWKQPDGPPSIPEQRFDDAASALAIADAELQRANALLELAEQRLADTVIRAPFDGVVSRRLVDPGQPVNAAPVTHVLEVQALDPIALEFSVPQKWFSRLRETTPNAPGSSVRFEVAGAKLTRGEASIERIYPALDRRTRSVRVRALVPNPEHLFRPGMLADVQVLP